MKTTIDISTPLLQAAKELAAREHTTLRALVEEGLRKVVEERERSDAAFELRDASVGGNGIRPGIDEGDWATLRSLAYEGRGE
jgi:hypothetical protein